MPKVLKDLAYGNAIYKTVMELEARDLRIMKAQAVCMITLFFSEMWIALESRSERHSIFHGPANFILYAVLILVMALLVALMQWDYFHSYLLLTGLSLYDWAFGIGASLIPVIIIEIYKKM